jgi:hypothetical protein
MYMEEKGDGRWANPSISAEEIPEKNEMQPFEQREFG